SPKANEWRLSSQVSLVWPRSAAGRTEIIAVLTFFAMLYRRPPAPLHEGAALMPYAAAVRAERFQFADLRELFAKANEEKSGDQLAGLAAANERERVAAKLALADVPLGD